MIDLLQPLFPGLNLGIIFVYLLVLLAMLAFVREWAPPDVVALSVLGAILVLGLLPMTDVVGGGGVLERRGLLNVFSNGAPITIACMFVLSAGLERTGAIDAMGRVFTRIAGKSQIRVMLILMFFAGLMSAFINNTPIVVVLLPIVVAHARATGLKTSKLLIPLSFASILGGTCTLTGTSTNLLVDGVAQDYGQPGFTMFEITKLGVVYALVGFVYVATIGRKLLPDRSSLAELLEPQTGRKYVTQFVVEENSNLIGKPLTGTLLKQFRGAQVIEIRRQGRILNAPVNELKIQEKDRLLVSLHGPSFNLLNQTDGIRFVEQAHLKELETREMKLMEGIIGPRSSLVSRSLTEIGFRQNYGILVLAIHRHGRNLRNNFSTQKLHFGDTLLMEGPGEAIQNLVESGEFVNISETPEAPFDPRKLWIGAGIMGGFILGVSTQVLPIPALAILAALAMILLRCLTPNQAYGAVQWNIVFLIFGMLALGMAMDQTGAAQLLVDGILAVFGGFSPFVILAVIYLLASIMTEMISNNAVAALLTPIVIGIAGQIEYAGELGVDPRPFIVALMFGCSASFATPIGYQTNTYVYGAGGYKFIDFVRVGVPLNLILWLVASCLIPVLWPFR